MCRMIGITNYDYKKHSEIIKNFIGLAKHGMILKGDTPGHPDGWGVGYYREGRGYVCRSAGSALKEKNAILGIIEDINKSKILMVHLRKSAWKNTNKKENSHPFISGNIIFAHNGTIYDYEKLTDGGPKKKAKTCLDSEVYFEFIMRQAGLRLEEKYRKALAHIKKNNVYSSLTCLFSDGKALYAYRDYMKHPSYYALFKTKKGNSDIVCSEPVENSLKWRLLGKGKLVCL